jgi:hypothetical protein
MRKAKRLTKGNNLSLEQNFMSIVEEQKNDPKSMYYQGLSEQQRQAIYQRMYYGGGNMSGIEGTNMSGMTSGSGMMVESGMTSGGGDNGMTDIHAFPLPSSSYYGQPDSVSASMYQEGVSSAYAHGTPTHHPMAHTASAGRFGFHPTPTDLQQSAHAAQNAA